LESSSVIEQLRSLPDARSRLAALSDAELLALRYDWASWRRPAQIAPAWDWVTWLVMAGRGFGKALSIDTPIATVSGWTTMGEIQAGEVVFDERGEQCRVIAAHPVQYGRPCYRVTFSDGASIVADEDHLWLTIDRRTRKAMRRRNGVPSEKPQCQPKHFPRVVTTKQIEETLYDGKEVNHAIPCAMPLQCNDADLTIDPYLLGAWLGDGASAGGAITTADAETVEAFEREGFTLTAYSNSGKADTYSISHPNGIARNQNTGRMETTGEAFCTKLKALNLIKNKHIPEAYMRGSVAQRFALIQGLFDTDGHCDKRTGSSEFCNKNKKLALQVLELALSLGVKAVMYEGRATLNGNDCGPKYRVCFTAHSDVPIFRLERKRKSQPVRGNQAERAYRRYIVSVDRVESVPVRCITVDSPSSLYLAGREMIPTHNTRVGAETVRQWIKDGRSHVNLVAATNYDLRHVMVDGESGILAVCPPDERPLYKPSTSQLIWPNGAVSLLFSAEEPDRLRGPNHDGLWTDEIAAWSRDQDAWDMAMFGLRLGHKPQIVATTTPRPTKMIRTLMADPTTAVTRGTTYDNKSNLAPTFYSQVIKKYEGTRLGRQELLAEVLDDNPGALFKMSDIDGARVAKLPPLGRIVVALDPAVTSSEDSDEWGIIAAGIDGRDPAHFYPLADESGIYTPDEAARVAVRLYHRLSADRIIGEANNGGDMIEALLRHVDPNVSYRKVTASRGKVVRAEPVSALYEQHRVHHHGTLSKLEDELTQWNPQTDDRSPNRLDACLTANSMVLTRRGEIPIKSVQIGDEAMTRRGWRRVLAAQMTQASASTITVEMSDGRKLRGTGNHPVFVQEKGFSRLDSLVCGDMIYAWSRKSFLTEFYTPEIQSLQTSRGAITFPLHAVPEKVTSIVKCGFLQKAKFLADSIFITLTGILSTTSWIISSVFHRKNMQRDMRQNTASSVASTSLPFVRWHLPGTDRNKQKPFIQSLGKNHGKIASETYSLNARGAGANQRASLSDQGNAIARADAKEQKLIASTDMNAVCIAPSVAESSGKTSTGPSRKYAPVFVVRSYASCAAPVYNLEVEGEHEYFANGILVHNCVWALTELSGAGDGMASYARGESKALSDEGVIAPEPGARIRVDGSNRDVCDCGSRVWCDNGGKQVCWKCGAPRPE